MLLKFHGKKRSILVSLLAVLFITLSVIFCVVFVIKQDAKTVERKLGFVKLDAKKELSSVDSLVIRQIVLCLEANTGFMSRFQSRTFTIIKVTWYEGKTLKQSDWCQAVYEEDFEVLKVSRENGDIQYKYGNVTRDKIAALAKRSTYSTVTINNLKDYGCTVQVFKD